MTTQSDELHTNSSVPLANGVAPEAAANVIPPADDTVTDTQNLVSQTGTSTDTNHVKVLKANLVHAGL